METITLLLQQWHTNPEAREEVCHRLAPILRAVAHRLKANEPYDPLAETDGLLDEAILKLVLGKPIDWKNRNHFVAVAALAMKRVLIGWARSRKAQKRGGGRVPLPLKDNDRAIWDPPDERLQIEEALVKLGETFELEAKIFDLAYFGGCSEEEVAESLKATEGISIEGKAVKRHLELARAWLCREILAEEKPG